MSKVEGSNDSLKISATAVSENAQQITYTLYTLDTNGKEEIATNVNENPITEDSGVEVTFTKTGLENNSNNSFVVKISDGKESFASNQYIGKTYCLGSYCEGGGTTNVKCQNCDDNGKVTNTRDCNTCGGDGKLDQVCRRNSFIKCAYTFM